VCYNQTSFMPRPYTFRIPDLKLALYLFQGVISCFLVQSYKRQSFLSVREKPVSQTLPWLRQCFLSRSESEPVTRFKTLDNNFQQFSILSPVPITWFTVGVTPMPRRLFRFVGPKLQTPKLLMRPNATCLFSSVIASSVFEMKLGKWACNHLAITAGMLVTSRNDSLLYFHVLKVNCE